jgi:CubicO group peptidase (beta-lactamase class C family)
MSSVHHLLGRVALAGALLAPLPAAAAQPPDPAALDTILREALRAWKVPGAAVAVVQRGRVVYLKGFGVRELGGDRRVTPDTLFALASCTKAFTTTALALLVDEGKLAWDDPVRKHVPFFRLADPVADAAVTLRDLVSHRTGVGSHDLLWYRSPWTQDELIRRIGRVKPSKPFRTAYQYQSVMVMAAGRAVETASGERWDQFVRRRLLGPLGMTGACFTTAEVLRSPDHASPHRQTSAGKVEVIPWYPMPRPDPAGSLCASVRDLSQWVLFQLGDGTFRGKRLVSARNLAETHAPQTIMHLEGSGRAFQPHTIQMSYAMGWVVQDYRGHLLVSHGGAIDGFRAHITLAPNDQLGIVLLNNLQGTQLNLAVSNSIVDLLLDLGTTDWNTYMLDVVKKEEAAKKESARRWRESRRRGTRPSRALSAYAGSYEHPAYGTARVVWKSGALAWEWSSFHGPLEHFHYDTFTARHDLLGDAPMVFRLNAAGEVAGLQFLGQDFRRKSGGGGR